VLLFFSTRRQFSDALFELVDEWCGTMSMVLFASFLDKVYLNVRAYWDTTPDGVERYRYLILEKRSFSQIFE
jgi:hypothetical protein